jgi:hypothetical protein
MSIHIIDRKRVPRDQYNATDPNQGRIFRANQFGRLVDRMQEYQRANNYRVWTEAEIEADYCQRYPYNCVDSEKPTRPADRSRADDILTGIAAAVGIPAADALAKLSTKLGVHCKTCAKRHAIIRRVRELGFHEALRQLKETL